MKYMNIIKLLTVLLCIGMLFVACDDAKTESSEEVTTEAIETPTGESGTESESETPTETATEIETEEALLEGVAGKFDNFFEGLDAESNELSSAARIEGDIIGYADEIVIIKSAEIDVKNIVTETYKVYNTATGESVLTVTDDYFNCSHDSFDFGAGDFRVFENTVLVDNGDKTFSPVTESEKTYRESYLTVQVREDLYYVNYIVVAKAEITPIDDEVREENPEGCVYEVAVSYAYYDVYGNLIAEANKMLDVGRTISRPTADVFATAFGNTIAYFDAESGKLIRTSNSINEEIDGIYAYENDRYGYYRAMYTNLLDGYMSYMDIVDKRSGEVLRYHFDNAYQFGQVFYLHNGDVLIQYASQVDEDEPYDFYENNYGSFSFYRLRMVILSADDGKETVVEKPEFYIQSLMTGEEYAEYANLADDNMLATTANARNVALVRMIKDGVANSTDDIVVLDNDLSILYTYEKIIEQQQYDDIKFGYRVLANGDMLVNIDSEDTPYAIVTSDGTVRSYLASYMSVVGEYVTDGSALYDYDMNLVCSYAQKDYRVIELFGECVFVSDKDGRYMTFEVSGSQIILEDLFDDEGMTLIENNEDYAIFQDANTGKFTLYNESMQAILVSSGYMNVYSLEDGGYLVLAYAGSEEACYVLK